MTRRAKARPRFSFGVLMSDQSDQPVSADDIEEQVAADAAAGIQSFSDGTNSVTAIDPMRRLEVAAQLRRNEAAQSAGFGLRTSKLRGGAAWQ